MATEAVKVERRPLWDVSCPAHWCGRHEVPETTVRLGGKTRQLAKVAGVRAIHARHGLPPWKPYLRITFRAASVRPAHDGEPDGGSAPVF